MSLLRSILAPLAAALLLSGPAACQDVDPYDQPSDSWIVIDGTVESVMADRFILDYGDGVITVEMDDGDRDADGYVLAEEDRVSVSGRIDDDLFEDRTIEASSVYVENLGTTFHASPIDEESVGGPVAVVTTPILVSRTIMEGTVTAIDDDEFTLDTGVVEVEVETEMMPYDPLDDEGYQQIQVGDRVRVTGQIDYDFFDGRVLDARTITTLINP